LCAILWTDQLQLVGTQFQPCEQNIMNSWER